MNRNLRTTLITVSVIAALLVGASVAFQMRDDARGAAFRFAVHMPAPALQAITEAAERRGTLAGSGAGVEIPGSAVPGVGASQWSISPNGVIHGTAPERGLSIVLTPEMREKKIFWTCRVDPEAKFQRGVCSFTTLPFNRH